MTSSRKMMGFDSPADQKVPIRVGDWNALKLSIWRSMVGWEIARRAAEEIVERCQHVSGCPGEESETEQCLPECPDREQRMSALVMLSAARTCAPVITRRPSEGQYFAPSREYFSEVLAELAAAQVELAAVHEALRRAGVAAPAPPPNEEPAELPKPAGRLLQNFDEEKSEPLEETP
jgi:hypothetical protein